ncbi:hypothetical protein GCM10023115_54570 [Pontixanthobacter gangjinensis]|uniref:Uncharacterized protein n=1 Tax=Pontixanthobacter gangjinensis TaxID=1028742 RepID=A0A6I4SQR9_9SPHN|nr:hypothetical protein [Pontixanthobacter gangjinensis]MXO57738.1 hypothetical protein [Pontixanthobacter gangjinensis]
MRKFVAFLLLSSAWPLSVAAQAEAVEPASTPPVPALAEPTAEQSAANATAKALGLRIYRHDQAAWHGTDALTGKIKFGEHPEIRDYLTEELADGRIALVYYAEASGKKFEFARLVVKGSTVISTEVHSDMTQHPLSASLEKQAAARQAALEQGVKENLSLCGAGGANIISLPADAEGQIAVYITSSQSVPYEFPLGGHYLLTVNDQNMVISGRAFMPGCYAAPIINEDVTNGPDDYSFAHILDRQPNEIHYFVAQYANVPLSITAGNALWTVGREAVGREVAGGSAAAQ